MTTAWRSFPLAILLIALPAAEASAAAGQCSAEQAVELVPRDPARCAALEKDIRTPSAFPLGVYERKLDEFLGSYCHRNEKYGWRRDKTVRDIGPFTAHLTDGRWEGQYRGTHAPVMIWYSPDMADWLVRNRAGKNPSESPPPPDGAIMVKEMFPAPARRCKGVDPLKLLPTNGAAIMIRDSKASHDGWFWGWYGFGEGSGWTPDWPAGPTNGLANMGFAQYCLNCHASAVNNMTFASPRNIEGEPGRPFTYLSQDFFVSRPDKAHHSRVATSDDATSVAAGLPDAAVIEALRAYTAELPDRGDVEEMPSATYDNTWVAAGGPTAADEFLTSSQCLGCHDAGSTGLQFDMTMPNPHGDGLLNLSPYATWRSSPMGLAGRDPFFFAQLASETEQFHPESAEMVEDTCLGCHGAMGQRQFKIDQSRKNGLCPPFRRSMLDTVPGSGAPGAAKYAMLARDGISCTVCHRMALGRDAAKRADTPENACVARRQALLNPHHTGFARTFTGSFFVGAPDALNGPFTDPRTTPMKNALGIAPRHDPTIASSDICGSCHAVHLPVLRDGKVLGHVYEQTTYAEWAFSGYRTGVTPDGPLPSGAGGDARSCQSCHMQSEDADGEPLRSKIASIEEYSNFPQVENVLGSDEIDLPERDGFALHTLVGLNAFLTQIALQFPDILGIPSSDPMLGSRGVAPLEQTRRAIMDNATRKTAQISVDSVTVENGYLTASVTTVNKAGHKFPSGVGFRRAFVDFNILGADGRILWESGRTNAAGALIDKSGRPLPGEYWWTDDCSKRIDPLARLHEPHFQTISRQDQVQIYQELVSAPNGSEAAPQCGHAADPDGPLTTSFLSICSTVKDNRILPKGFLPRSARKEIAAALGAGDELAHEAAATAVGGDPDYVSGGKDTLVYRVPLAALPEKADARSVVATLYYQATPPFYLQDRLCTAHGDDAKRLRFLVGRLDLAGTRSEGWKLKLVSTGAVPIDAAGEAGSGL